MPEVPVATLSGIHCGFDGLITRRKARGERGGRLPRADRLSAFASEATAIRVSVAQAPEHFEAAESLVRRRYSWRGYDVGTPEDSSSTSGSARSGHEITFVALDDQAALGTITLGLDGPNGLHADETHAEAVDAVRAEGRRVCELTRLAVAERADSRWVLASMFSLVYAAGRTVHGVTDVFIEVNPRHVTYYARLLGFVIAAGERFCERVRAPSVLLRLDVDKLEERLQMLGFGGVIAPPLLAEAA